VSKLDDDIAMVAEMQPAQLREQWEHLDGSPAPALAAPLLRRLLAQRLQEQRHGGLPALVRRELLRIAEVEQVPAPARPRPQLTTGARLVREWNGRTIMVEVSDCGFQHAGRSWRSLSEIACHVTGAHWSGPRFFGLTPRLARVGHG
jgi:hypothetical protein